MTQHALPFVPKGMVRYRCSTCKKTGMVPKGTDPTAVLCPVCNVPTEMVAIDAGKRPPLTPMRHSNERQWVRLGARTAAKVMRMLWDAPCAIRDIREETGLAESSIRDYIAALRALKMVHVCGKAPAADGIRRVDVYRLDPGKPDVRIERKSGAKRSADYRERKRLHRVTMLGTLDEQFAPIEQRKTRDSSRKEPV